jgi:hypothetical protein
VIVARGKSKREAKAEAVSTVRVPLTDEQRVAKGLEMARELQVIAGLEDEKKQVTSGLSADIKTHKARAKKLAEELVEGVEQKAQRDITFDEQKRMDDGAKQALHDIAQHTCTCDGGPSAEVKSPSCPTHGVDGPEAQKAKAEREAKRSDEEAAAEVARSGEAGTAPEVAHLDAMVAAAAVDVGIVEEPKAVAEHRARSRRRLSEDDGEPRPAA